MGMLKQQNFIFNIMSRPTCKNTHISTDAHTYKKKHAHTYKVPAVFNTL